MKSRFKTLDGTTIELRLEPKRVVWALLGVSTVVAPVPLTVDEAEIMRDEFARYAAALRQEEANAENTSEASRTEGRQDVEEAGQAGCESHGRQAFEDDEDDGDG